MWKLCLRMFHIRQMAFPLRSYKRHPSVSNYLNFSSNCLCVPRIILDTPLVHLLTSALSLRLCYILLVLSSSPTISVVSYPGLPSRDISLTTSSSHHYDRWMEIVWLRDPNSTTALHYQTFANFLRLMDFLFGTAFIFCYGLDLLVVVSLFLSEFSPFLFILCCVYLCSPLFIT